MSTLNDNDLFVYQEAATGNVGAVANNNRSSLADDDLFVVWGTRNGVTQNWKVKSSDVGSGEFTEVLISPLTITPEPSDQYLTCSTDIAKVNGAIPADVIWNWYQYDGSTGNTGKTLLKTLTNRESVDTLLLPSGAADKYIGCSVEYLAVTIDETARCSVGQPTGPVAVMDGLRFDSGRGTHLEGSEGSNTFTFSCWVKPTGSRQYLVSFGGFATWIDTNGAGNWQFGNNGGAVLVGPPAVQNQWTHIVVSNDPAGSCSLFVNGQLEASDTGVTPAWTDQPLTIGQNTGNTNYGDQYLSDYYFVDGSVLPPTVFGEQFAEGWGPLDSTQVKANIPASGPLPPEPPEQPYDSRANTSQTWSANLTTDGTFETPATNAFDGSESTEAYATGTAAKLFYTFNPPVTGEVEIQMRNESRVVKTDDDTVLATTDVNNSIARFDAVNLSGITLSSPSSRVNPSYFKVNGRLLVDQGVWDNSQNWSDNVSTSAGALDSGGLSVIGFDGNLTTPCYANNSNAIISVDLSSYNLSGELSVAFASSASMEVKVVANGATAIDWRNLTSASQLESLGTISNIETIQFKNDGGGSGNFSAIAIDDAILVDSGAQYDTSQRWSDYSSGGDNPANIFDGVYSSAGSTNSLLSTNSETILDGVSITGSSVSFAYSFAAGGRNFTLTFSDLSTTTIALRNTSFGLETYDLGSSKTITKIVFDAGTALGLNAVKIGDKILVDAAPVWNTSQVWSDSVNASGFTQNTVFTEFSPDLIFTSNPPSGGDTKAVLGNGTITFDPPVVASAGSKIYVNVKGSGSTPGDFTTNSGDFPCPVPNFGWVDVGTTLSSITLKNVATVSGDYFGGVKIDDELLVDAATFGTNGFYLPFDPAATGANYSSKTTASGTFESNVNGSNVAVFSPVYVWDGKFTAGSQTGIKTLDGGSQFTLTFSSAITIDAIWYSAIDGASTLTTNNGTITLPSAGGTTKTLELNAASGSTTSVTVSGNAASILGFISNGVLLVDHSSIGVDDSGNGNNFVDQNFVTADNSDRSQVWSNGLTSSAGFGSNDPPQNGFDGNLTTKAGSSGNSQVLTFTGSVAYTQSVRVYISWGTTHDVNVSLNGGAAVTDPGNVWTTIATGSGTINTLTFTGTTNSGAVSAIEVDGKILVDPSFVDTVLDTPMKNYAVLEEDTLKAKNGNLVAYHDGAGGAAITTIPLDLNGKYYFEAVTNQNQNIGAGIQNNSGSIGNPGAGPQNGLYAIFSYLPTGYERYNNTTKTVISGTTPAAGDVLGVAVDMTTKEVALFVNGSQVDTFTMSNTDDSQGYRFCAITGNSPGAEVPVNFGQQPWIHTPPAGYEGLYQTWSQWVTTTTRALLEVSESRVDALEQVILSLAQPWTYGSSYSTGDLVKFNCSVWRATADGITTRTPIPTNSDIWENLYINCERTHTMDDLIPDDWSQEQRRAALQELLLELSEDEPEGY